MKQKYPGLKIITLFVLLFSAVSTVAQVDRLLVYGTVKDERSGKKLQDVQVTLVEDGETKKTYATALSGKFELDLDFEHDYDIRFSKDGYVSKFININTKNVPEENQVGGFGFDLDMSLFEEVEGVNFDVLKKPIGKANYVPETGEIGFDYEYTRSIQAEIARLRRELEKKYREEEERLRKEQEEAERLRKLQEQFDKLVAEGDTEFGNSNFMNAVFKYSDALDLIPGVAVVEQKLAKAKAALEEQQRQAELDAKYNATIKDADNALSSNALEEAQSKYEAALALKPDEAYPQQQLNTVKAKLEEKRKKEALEKEYQDAIAAGDQAIGAKQYQEAITSYQTASQLKPQEAYPKDQIAKAQEALDAIQRQKELEQQYADLITAADASFGKEAYDDAIGLYKEALGLKPDEAYPRDQIEKAKAALNAQLEAQKQEELYNNLIANADKSFGFEDYEVAIADYKKALEIKPNEQYPKDQIAKSEEALAAIAAEEEKKKRFEELIMEADANFNAKEYELAINNYNKASELFPERKYPQEQVVKAQAALDALAAAKEREAQYKALIQKADGQMGSESYQEAISTYQQAIQLNPDDQYPKDQISKAQAALEAKAAEEQAYTDAIAAGDAAFGNEQYQDAIGKYQEALQIKAGEAYPTDQIAKAEAALKAAEEAQKKEEEYNALIAKADGAMDQESYQSAITDYQAALQIKPEAGYPKEQISKAQAALDAIQEQQALEEQYNALIASADQKFEAKEYQAAITDYQAALQLQVDESYPKAQITKAQAALEALKKQQELERQYQDAIAKGDAAFNGKDYNAAIGAYQEALQIKPGEPYPTDQITKANEALAALEKAKAAEEQYNQLVSKADGEFNGEQYNEAINTYNQALKVKPDAAYPKEQINKAQAALDAQAKEKELDMKYQELVNQGDQQMGNEAYQDAIASYQGALEVKPNEQYPKDKIAEAEGALELLAEQKAKEEQYLTLIAEGDQAFDAQKYEAAIGKYQSALQVKPGEQYPKDQIAAAENARDAMLAAKEKEKRFAQLVADADVLFDSTQYRDAIGKYQQALQIKPEDPYSKKQIAQAEQLQAQKEKEQQLQEQYLAYIEQGDAAFGKEQYQAAIVNYQDALTLKPGEAYPKEQIGKAQAELDKLQQAYDAAVQFGDEEMEKKSYLTAITSYENALAIFPDESYPKQRIEEARAAMKAEEEALAQKQADELLAQQEEEKKDPTIVSFQDITKLGNVNKDSIKAAVDEPEVEEETNPEPKVMYRTTSEGDLEAFRRKLGENYPEGVTKEKYRESNKDIFRTIFVDNGLGDELLRVVARFGTFYFKNGSSISSQEYNRFLDEIGVSAN